MVKQNLIDMSNEQVYSRRAKKNYVTNKTVVTISDTIWNSDIPDIIDYRITNKGGYRFNWGVIDQYSSYVWGIPLRNKTV